MPEIELSSLDGGNPLGFLAALGALAALSERRPPSRPTLAWVEKGRWVPVIYADLARADITRELLADLESWRGAPVVSLQYPKKEDTPAKLERDLKAPPGLFREYLSNLLKAQRDDWHRALHHAAAFSAEGVTDNNGKTKPFALHFTAGQQEFLGMVAALLGDADSAGVTAKSIDEALFEPWIYASPLPVLGWDATVSRDYALRASNPSTDKKLGVPGADWLAFRGLGFFRSVSNGSRLRTTACSGGWKDGKFTWPLWAAPISAATAAAVLNLPRSMLESPIEREARGIACVMEAAIRRSEQGGYGSFSPARVL